MLILNLTTTYSDHLPQVLLVPGFYQHKNVFKSNVFIRDRRTFNDDTFPSDYPKIARILYKDLKGILIFLFKY